jgi:hypothetical protein
VLARILWYQAASGGDLAHPRGLTDALHQEPRATYQHLSLTLPSRHEVMDCAPHTVALRLGLLR